MIKLCNRGLGFAILPIKLDLTEVLVDFKKFERSTIWHEFWHNREKEENYKRPIFRKQKTNLPKNHTSPKELKNVFRGNKIRNHGSKKS